MPRLLLLDCDYREETMLAGARQVLDEYGLEVAGKTVLLKPNMLGAWKPETGVTTHPSLVLAMRVALEERGARVQVGDNPGVAGYGAIERCGRRTGLAEAAGEGYLNMAREWERVPLHSRFCESTIVSKAVLQADLLVSLPKFKTHMGTVFTGAIKNSFGFLVGAEKARMHTLAPRPSDFGELLLDIYLVRPPDLVVIDAGTVMEGNGPSGGTLRQVGKLIAGVDGVALDALAAHMMGVDPRRIPALRAAERRGPGSLELDSLEVEGPFEVIPRFKLPMSLASSRLGGVLQYPGFSFIARPRLKADPKLCNGCGTCEKHCPVNAIELRRRPVFNRSACIGCYCCYELCPERALKPRSLFGMLRPL